MNLPNRTRMRKVECVSAHRARRLKDAQMRPITAGWFVDGAPVYLLDVTYQAGLDKFHHRSTEHASLK